MREISRSLSSQGEDSHPNIHPGTNNTSLMQDHHLFFPQDQDFLDLVFLILIMLDMNILLEVPTPLEGEESVL